MSEAEFPSRGTRAPLHSRHESSWARGPSEGSPGLVAAHPLCHQLGGLGGSDPTEAIRSDRQRESSHFSLYLLVYV